MVVFTVEEFDVQVHARILGNALEEVFEHGSLDTARHCSREIHVPDKSDTVAEIEANAGKRLVHRDEVEPVTFDSLLVAQAFDQRLAEHDSDVFHAVVHIDIRIALAGEVQAETAVHLEKIEHVVEEPVAGIHDTARSLVEIERKLDIRLARLP